MISNDFLDNLYGKTVSILGLGISNMPLMRVLVKFGATVTGFDKKSEDKIEQRIKDELFHHSVPCVLGDDYLEHIDADYIFRTPGMRPDLPQIVKAQEKGAVLMSEMELFFELCPCPIIAVTGSDGKTTTTTLIAEMLKKQGKTVHIGGNIGTPLIDKVFDMKETHVAVVELSSFQLMTMKKSPKVAVITNLSPNHLDVHKDMEEYVWAKENIFMHQGENDVIVLNKNCPYTADQAAKAPSKVRFFSPHEEIENGVCCDDEWIYINENGVRKNILQRKDIKIVGFHNVENYMTAIAALHDMVDVETIVDVAKNFGGVEHRIEFVREIDGVKYYNDSIASSPTRTIAGFHSFNDKVILIAGGSDKHIPFDGLAEEIIDHVKALVLVGATANAIKTAVEANPRFDASKLPVFVCENLREAVNVCKANAVSGDVVTMSPACASFDLYKNFMERGNLFKEIVNNL
ncbi:MAG: UDP-N-acetylmuramoyl-L-alanine--D-glutamate ligase [Clostridia bacterium]|nr:UDP-N-acetylmuramoyl-L-alanine--D-glutamate ligase [Clostridia bacterium]